MENSAILPMRNSWKRCHEITYSTNSKIDYVLKSCTFSGIFSPLSIKAKNKSRCKMNTNYKKKFL